MKINFKKIGVGFATIIGFCIFSCSTISAENTGMPFIGKVMCTNPNHKAFQMEITHTIDQEKVVISTIMLSEKGKKSPNITEGKIIESSKEKVSWSVTFPGEDYVGQLYKGEIDLKAGTLYTDFVFMSPKERDFRILEGNICKVISNNTKSVDNIKSNVEKIEKTVEPFIGKVMCTNPNQNEAWRAEVTHTIDQQKVILSTIFLADKGKKSPNITEGKIIESSKEKVSWSFTFPGEKYVGQVYKNEIDLKAGTKYTDFLFRSPKEKNFRVLEGTICKILN